MHLPLPTEHLPPGKLQMFPGQQMSPAAAPHAHSQPFCVLPSQLPKFNAHDVKAHEPALHAMPFAWTSAVVQFFVHDPQRVAVVRRFVSQPVFPESQWPKPLAHAHVHEPAAQLGVPLAVLHAVPQPPQLSGSAFVSMQSLSQHVLPFGHVEPASASQPSTHAPAGLHCLPPVQSAVFTHSTH